MIYTLKLTFQVLWGLQVNFGSFHWSFWKKSLRKRILFKRNIFKGNIFERNLFVINLFEINFFEIATKKLCGAILRRWRIMIFLSNKSSHILRQITKKTIFVRIWTLKIWPCWHNLIWFLLLSNQQKTIKALINSSSLAFMFLKAIILHFLSYCRKNENNVMF